MAMNFIDKLTLTPKQADDFNIQPMTPFDFGFEVGSEDIGYIGYNPLCKESCGYFYLEGMRVLAFRRDIVGVSILTFFGEE